MNTEVKKRIWEVSGADITTKRNVIDLDIEGKFVVTKIEENLETGVFDAHGRFNGIPAILRFTLTFPEDAEKAQSAGDLINMYWSYYEIELKR